MRLESHFQSSLEALDIVVTNHGAKLVQAMGNFLQLSSRGLKQSSLEALDIVVTNHGAKLNVELFDSVLKEHYGS